MGVFILLHIKSRLSNKKSNLYLILLTWIKAGKTIDIFFKLNNVRIEKNLDDQFENQTEMIFKS